MKGTAALAASDEHTPPRCEVGNCDPTSRLERTAGRAHVRPRFVRRLPRTRIEIVATESTTRPRALHFTGDDEADRLLAEEPLALLIGFVLDQQVSVQKAFSSPLELQRRIGALDAEAIAGMDPRELEEAFRRKPALHRFPGTMATRTQELCAAVASEHGGDAARVWTEATTGEELERRLLDLPGIGPMKAKTLISIL